MFSFARPAVRRALNACGSLAWWRDRLIYIPGRVQPAGASSFRTQCWSSYGSTMPWKPRAIRLGEPCFGSAGREPGIPRHRSGLFFAPRRRRRKRAPFYPGNTGLRLCRSWRFTSPMGPVQRSRCGVTWKLAEGPRMPRLSDGNRWSILPAFAK